MNVLIIGNGIAGITAARHLRKLSDDVTITVISDETDYFFSRTALMYVFMGHMKSQDVQPYENWFWEKNRINLVRARVTEINFDLKQLHTNADKILSYNKLIIATGSKPNKFGWKGQDLDGVQGLYHWQDLETMQRHAKKGVRRAVIVGGGLIGIEMAEMFLSHKIPVTFLVREKSFWNTVLPSEESEMVNRHIKEHGIDLRLESELSEILDENNDGVADAVVLKSGEKMVCDFVGLTVGVSPNINFAQTNTQLKTNQGIIVNDFLETNIADVYAIGDCAEIDKPQIGRKSIEAVWYTGRMMGETVAKNIIAGRDAVHRVSTVPTPYNPGIWFNSAKFLDIEYQVYGELSGEYIYWEHTDGKKSIRICYDKDTGAVRGFNLMGIRYRHAVCEKWIAEQTHIEEVLQHLGMANFDPEFFREYETSVVDIYNKNSGKNIVLKTKRGLNPVLKFLMPHKS